MNADKLYSMLDGAAAFVADHSYVKHLDMHVSPEIGLAQIEVEDITGERLVFTRYYRAEAR